MSFPTVYREIRRLAIDTVWDTPTARDIARKAGVKVSGEGVSADIWGTFSQINDESGGGFVSEYLGESYLFPDDSVRMERFSDMSGTQEARLLVTVTRAGNAGSTLSISSDQITFSTPPNTPLDVLGVHVSNWHTMTLSATEVLLRWVVSNPSLEAGSFGLGLCQLQVR